MTFQFHSVIQQAYLDVHDWLVSLPRTKGYIDIKKPCPDKVDMMHVAAQFASYFPTHHFKNVFALNNIVASDAILDQLHRNPNMVVVDIGCGGGAASGALVSAVLELQAQQLLRSGINLLCIGVDPSENVLGIYSQFMNCVKQQLPSSTISLDFRVVDRPMSESVTDLEEHLRVSLSDWVQPALPHVFLMQSNVVWPLDRLYVNQQERHDRLNKLEVPANAYIPDAEFGMRESRSYRQLFRQLPIDNLYTITVGTNKDRWSVRVDQMGASLATAFKGHEAQQIATGRHQISFRNPNGSYWWKKKSGSIKPVETLFPLDVRMIKNTGLDGDQDWHKVIKMENLELAWARARALLQREVLYDEIEIRLFERNRKANLKRLHQELGSYEIAVAHTNDRLQFKFVKSEEEGRPRVLSRIEEEIVSIAIVQELGAAAFGLNATSYAYRPNPRFASRSEFLYEYWFPAYQRYKSETLNAVAKHSNCKVLSIDIKSYYTGIPQQPLVESAQMEMRTKSDRIGWLLQRLICVDLDGHEHKRGLSQGGAGSGFYANAYLTEFDSKFGIDKQWGAQLFRFVDDIVIVIPDPDHLSAVDETARAALGELGLKVNPKKSDIFNQENFLNLPQDKGIMDGLSERFESLTKPLWRTNSEFRKQLDQKCNWWPQVGMYRDHLHSVGHYIEPHRLSRKLDQYVEKYRVKSEDEEGKRCGFTLPPLDAPNWSDEFKASNGDWVKERRTLRSELVALAKDSYRDLETVDCPRKRRLLSTLIYFSANRLATLGFGDSAVFFMQILINQPWIIRQPQYVIRSLAIQGFSTHIECLFDHYSDLDKCWSSSFLAVIIRAIRHLHEVPEPLEAGVIRIAIDSNYDPILRLLATETWLMRFDCQRVLEYEAKIRQIVGQEQSARVGKNYLLLLGKCMRDRPQHCDYDDPLMMSASEVALSGSLEDLFNYEEPDILRERYYSRYYPDNFSDFGDDGYY